MFFIIFKLPRTGSSRLVKYLNYVSDVRCEPEIFNKIKNTNINISDYFLDKINTNSAIGVKYGCSINPFKYNIQDIEFIDIEKIRELHSDIFIFSLIRENTFDQSLSIWVVKYSGLNMWPGDGVSDGALEIRKFLEKDITIPVLQFKKIYEKLKKQNYKLIEFSRSFAEKNKFQLIELTYEGLYNNSYSHVKKIESALEISIDKQLVSSEEKLLPNSFHWIKNIDELKRNFL